MWLPSLVWKKGRAGSRLFKPLKMLERREENFNSDFKVFQRITVKKTLPEKYNRAPSAEYSCPMEEEKN